MLSPLVVVKYPTAAACPLCAPQRVGRVASTPVASKPTSRGRSGLVRLTSRGEAVSAYADALDRRAVVLAAPSAALAQLLLAGVAAAEAEVAGAEAAEVASVAPARGKKVVVLGGNGFVGSRVCKALVDAGCEVVSVSRSGTPPSWAAGSDWVGSVTWSKARDANPAFPRRLSSRRIPLIHRSCQSVAPSSLFVDYRNGFIGAHSFIIALNFDGSLYVRAKAVHVGSKTMNKQTAFVDGTNYWYLRSPVQSASSRLGDPIYSRANTY